MPSVKKSSAQPPTLKKLVASCPDAAPSFVEPMLLLPTKTLPEGHQWLYEVKFDGFRGLVLKTATSIQIISRNRRDLTRTFSAIAEAFAGADIPIGVYDGEIVCLDEKGKACFNDLQNFAPRNNRALHFYAFDLLNLAGKDVTRLALNQRKEILSYCINGKSHCIRISETLDAAPLDIIEAARSKGLEGVVAKKQHSRHEAGKRSGAWMKFKLLQEEVFAVGGYHHRDFILVADFRIVSCAE
jgi:bifunctional non-homologous end joining protein LigD